MVAYGCGHDPNEYIVKSNVVVYAEYRTWDERNERGDPDSVCFGCYCDERGEG